MTAVLDGSCVTLPALGSSNGNTSSTAPAVCNQSVETLPPYSPEAMVAFATVITLMMLFTVFGNVLVIIAVQTSRLLRSPQNLFLVSLAAADILVAALIIPFSLANELMGYWYFRSVWCEIYLALDVLFCTSSIVHLCAISLDRYLSVSRAVRYSGQRTPRRIKAAILVVWLISAVISFPPLLSANKGSRGAESRVGPQCQLNSERWYILYSTVGSFFVPCLIMILVYLRIYQIAKRHTRCPPGAIVPPPLDAPLPSQQNSERAPKAYKISGLGAPLSPDTVLPASTLAPARTPTVPPPSPVLSLPKGPRHFWSSPNRRQSKLGDKMADSSRCCSSSGSDGEGEDMDPPSGRGGAPNIPGPVDGPPRALPPGRGPLRNTIITAASGITLVEVIPSPARQRAAMNREKRFTFVLAVVIGVFVICWFPFFFSYSLKAICPEVCAPPEPLFKFFFWIGYCNSSLNPLIYTIFNKDFRRAFKKILCHDTRDTVF